MIDQASLVRLYGAFDRQPDEGGFTGWMNSGMSLNEVATEFTLSSEFLMKFDSITDGGYVDQLYNRVLDRSPSQGELDSWLKVIADNPAITKADLLLGFTESPEAKAKADAGIVGHAPSMQEVIDAGNHHAPVVGIAIHGVDPIHA